MDFFKRLFGKNKSELKMQNDMTIDDFLETEYVKKLVKKYVTTATLLRPHKSNIPINSTSSKFGGIPNFEGFNSYPICPTCRAPLNFVLQIYKKDFQTFYFPNNLNLFQLFRCPNNDCSDSYSDQYDHKMFPFYFNTSEFKDKTIIKPSHEFDNIEKVVPDCYLKPIESEDFPNYDDYEGNDFVIIEEKFGNKLSEFFMDKYSAIQKTKFGGYPSYTQSPNYPICSCGKTKEFFFQLSSEDIEDGIGYPPPSDKWSPHGIMIGDVGNIYFYVCKTCGIDSIESNWDCY
jgi:hypothetical protein